MKTKMFVCPVCGNVIMKLVDSGVSPHCCGREMELLQPQLTEEAGVSEKHLPEVSLVDESSIEVRVGSVLHPMTDKHAIRFVLLETGHGVQVRFLSPENTPTAKFYCGYDQPEGVFSFCNLHGLWATHHLPPTVKHSSCRKKGK